MLKYTVISTRCMFTRCPSFRTFTAAFMIFDNVNKYIAAAVLTPSTANEHVKDLCSSVNYYAANLESITIDNLCVNEEIKTFFYVIINDLFGSGDAWYV